MDHQQCFEHVVIPEGTTCGAREVIWRSRPYMGLEVILVGSYPITEELLHPSKSGGNEWKNSLGSEVY